MNAANKENMMQGAMKINKNINQEISNLASKTSFACSCVARVAYGAKEETTTCGANPYNAWVMAKMHEVNSLFFSFHLAAQHF